MHDSYLALHVKLIAASYGIAQVEYAKVVSGDVQESGTIALDGKDKATALFQCRDLFRGQPLVVGHGIRGGLLALNRHSVEILGVGLDLPEVWDTELYEKAAATNLMPTAGETMDAYWDRVANHPSPDHRGLTETLHELGLNPGTTPDDPLFPVLGAHAIYQQHRQIVDGEGHVVTPTLANNVEG